MAKSKFDIFLTVLLAILIVGIIGTAGFLSYKYYQKFKINKDADEFLNEFDQIISNRTDDEDEENYTYDNEVEENAIKEQTGNPVRGISTNALNYKGFDVSGKIEMPTVNLQYPVLSQMTDANAIEVSVAIQYGVGLNKPGNTVIIGHNYRSGLFFGSNKRMQIGDSIYITDWETGTRRLYKIYNKYTTEEADTSFYNRDTNGAREVSLVTCQSNNAYRLVILAREELE